MYKIGEFSRLSKITVRMLRHYDEVNLLKPIHIDQFTGYRYYSSSQLSKSRYIVLYRDMGFGVDEIKELINSNTSDVEKLLLNKLEETSNSISKENDRLKLIKIRMKSLGKESNMKNKVEVKSISSIKVISLRNIIPNYYAEGDLWAKLGKYAEENKIEVTNDVESTGITIYYDDEWKQDDCDVEVCMKVKVLGKSTGDIVFKEIEAIEKVACINVEGNYDKLSEGYATLGQWIEENDYTICGNCRQINIKHPSNERNPDKYLTEIQIPIDKLN
ncbi:MAG: MerR family transcriptional regulator [Bacilli bacterium]